jgi:hypothetical protein
MADELIKIFERRIRIANEASMDSFFETLKDAANARRYFESGERGPGAVYDSRTQSASYLASDGMTIVCFTLVGVTPEQAGRIRDEVTRQNVFERAEYADFQAAVERALGVAFAPPPQ